MAFVTSSTAPSSRCSTAAASLATEARYLGFPASFGVPSRSSAFTRSAWASLETSVLDGSSRPRSMREIVASAMSARSATCSWVSPAARRRRRRFAARFFVALPEGTGREADGHVAVRE